MLAQTLILLLLELGSPFQFLNPNAITVLLLLLLDGVTRIHAEEEGVDGANKLRKHVGLVRPFGLIVVLGNDRIKILLEILLLPLIRVASQFALHLLRERLQYLIVPRLTHILVYLDDVRLLLIDQILQLLVHLLMLLIEALRVELF